MDLKKFNLSTGALLMLQLLPKGMRKERLEKVLRHGHTNHVNNIFHLVAVTFDL